MPFQRTMRDKVKVIKSDGQEIENLKASIQSKEIIMQMQPNLFIEPKDIIQRIMSNGGTETFEVIDPVFYEAFHNIPAHYIMEVKKLGIPEAEKAIESIIYNISGANARVNNNSTDNSTNILNVNQDVTDHLTLLRQEIEKIVSSNIEKKDAIEVVDAIQGQFESGTPSKAVIKTLLSALPHAGSIASIGSFLISAISG
ncbi:MAG: hypothetical protein QM493_01765 [Sulfurovum sp.]